MNGQDFLGFAAGTAIVITGAGSGIGEAIALTCGKLGLKVACWDLSGEAAERTAQAIRQAGGEALACSGDASDAAEVARCWKRTTDAFGAVACLAASAGPPSFGDKDFSTALSLAIDCMRVPTEAWLEQPDAGSRSAIYISSVQGPRYGAGVPWYTVAKSGIDGYMRSLAAMRPGGIRANAILPDWLRTARTEQYIDATGGDGWETNPMGRVGYAQDSANAAIFLLSPAAEYINGVSLEVDGGAKLRSMAWMRMWEASKG